MGETHHVAKCHFGSTHRLLWPNHRSHSCGNDIWCNSIQSGIFLRSHDILHREKVYCIVLKMIRAFTISYYGCKTYRDTLWLWAAVLTAWRFGLWLALFSPRCLTRALSLQAHTYAEMIKYTVKSHLSYEIKVLSGITSSTQSYNSFILT